MKPYRPLLVKPMASTEDVTVPEGEADLTPRQTADLINDLIMRSQALLKEHPVNKKRAAAAKTLPTASGHGVPAIVRKWKKLSDKFPQVKRGAVISAVDLINGIGTYAGLRRLTVEGQPDFTTPITRIRWRRPLMH